MNKFISRNLYPLVVFITGGCVLIIEVVAIRVLSPHYGNTIFSISSVISVILAALGVGYYAGGRFADRYPSPKWFFGIILLSGLVVLALHLLGTLILPILSLTLPLTYGPLISAMLLFFFPAFLLGTLSPFAIKLQSILSSDEGIGSISGRIFFWSTIGSILGSLLAGFVLIPRLGLGRIFILAGIALFLLGFIPIILRRVDKKSSLQALIAILILVSLSVLMSRGANEGVLYSKDGFYEKIIIYDGSYGERPARFFQQDRSGSGAMFLDTDDPTDLVFEYTKYYALYRVFKPEVQNALVIGGGAYSIPKALLFELPNARIDVAEIEPSLSELSERYFKLKSNPNLTNQVEDGRRLIQDSTKKYDLIFSDVYYSLYSIPAHFTTREFFSLAKDKMSPDGVFIANLIGDLSRQKPSLIFAEIKTFKSVFPNSLFFAVESPKKTTLQNIIFVGYNSEREIDLKSDEITRNSDPIVKFLHTREINLDRFDLTSYPILTDDFAPVEYLTAKVLRRASSDGGAISGDEMLTLIDQQLSYGPRYIGSPGHENVQKFLIAELEEFSDRVLRQTLNYVGTDGETYDLTNIIGRINPERNRRIILATHYDSKRLADKDVWDREAAVPGANDSASGVAVLLELARIISTTESKPDIGIDIIFFDGEEGDINQEGDYTNWKPLGSTYFSERLNDFYVNNKPIGALVLDMVCDKDLRIYKELSSMVIAPQQTEAFWRIASSINNRVFQKEARHNILDDHTPLNRAGIPSILIIDFEYPPFHTSKDTLDKCSAKSLETVARAVQGYIYSLQ